MGFWRIKLSARIATCLLLCCVFTFAVGCQHTPKVAYRLDVEGNPVDYKRHEQHPQRDFVHHFVREVYHKPGSPEKLSRAGASQAVVIENWGVPDWVRKPFRAIQNEKVNEWIYLDQARVFQFVGPDLVFEGPLTDHEITLLQRGYPDRAELIRLDGDKYEKLYIYDGVPPQQLEQFLFRDDQLKFSKETH